MSRGWGAEATLGAAAEAVSGLYTHNLVVGRASCTSNQAILGCNCHMASCTPETACTVPLRQLHVNVDPN